MVVETIDRLESEWYDNEAALASLRVFKTEFFTPMRIKIESFDIPDFRPTEDKMNDALVQVLLFSVLGRLSDEGFVSSTCSLIQYCG